MTLQLLICTINEGIRRVPSMLLPERDDVKYLVSWQKTGTVSVELPEELTQRADVEVYTLDGRGLAVNRNNALRHATGDILLLADDDSSYKPEYFDIILRTFRRYVHADIICFPSHRPLGKLPETLQRKALDLCTASTRHPYFIGRDCLPSLHVAPAL